MNTIFIFHIFAARVLLYSYKTNVDKYIYQQQQDVGSGIYIRNT